MRRFGDEDKPSLEELAHHGVKGQKWGVRKKRPSSAEIHAARTRQMHRRDQFFVNDRQIALAPNARARAAAVKQQDKFVKDFATNEDRVTAARLTRGEKAVHIILLGPLAAVTLPAASAHARSVARSVDAARANA